MFQFTAARLVNHSASGDKIDACDSRILGQRDDGCGRPPFECRYATLKGVNLDKIQIFEIKSTRKEIPADFSGYFFALTAAEVLVAQSLKKYFKFIFVNVNTGDFLEMNMRDIFAKSRGIYPTWSILF